VSVAGAGPASSCPGQAGGDEAGQPIADPEAQVSSPRYRERARNPRESRREPSLTWSKLRRTSRQWSTFPVFCQRQGSGFFTTTPYPAWTAIGRSMKLALPGMRVEIKAIASLKNPGRPTALTLVDPGFPIGPENHLARRQSSRVCTSGPVGVEGRHGWRFCATGALWLLVEPGDIAERAPGPADLDAEVGPRRPCRGSRCWFSDGRSTRLVDVPEPGCTARGA